jgi:hypothetical protein
MSLDETISFLFLGFTADKVKAMTQYI